MDVVGTDRLPVGGVEVLGMAALAASEAAAARGALVTAAMADLVVVAARPKTPVIAVHSVDMPTLRMVAAARAWVAPFSATAAASRSVTARSTTTLQRKAWPARQLVIVEARPAMATASAERFFRATVQ
jgi:hypothetical protein